MPPRRPPFRTKSEKSGPEGLTFQQAADRLGLTRQAIGVWAAKPGAPVTSDNGTTLVLWPAFARWRETQMVEKAVRDTAPTVSLDEARTRKALAEAELAELEVAKARGDFVAVADYETALGRSLDRVTARLRAMPVRLSSYGAEVEAAVESEVEAVIVELSQMDADVLDEPAEEPKEGVA